MLIIDITEEEGLDICEVCKDALAVTEIKGTIACRPCGKELERKRQEHINKENTRIRNMINRNNR